MSFSRIIFTVLFFTAKVNAADPIYKKVGASVDLNPGQSFDSISSVTWKHQSDLALEWFGGEITCFRDFHGRCDFDETVGSFTINNLTLEDTGMYTPEINFKVLDQQQLQVLKMVPKPTVSKKCNNEIVCHLTCDVQITSGFGPVTYKWESGNKVLSNDPKLMLTKENEERSFICIVKNPVSSESSEEVDNPFSSGYHVGRIVGVVSGILLLIGMIGAGVYMYRKDHLRCLRRMWPFNQKPQGGDVSVAEEEHTLLEINSGAEKPKVSTCEHAEVSVFVHPPPALSEASNQVPATKRPETTSQTDEGVEQETKNEDQSERVKDSRSVSENKDGACGDVAAPGEHAGAEPETKSEDQQERAKDSTSVSENKDGAETASLKESDEETSDQSTPDEDQS